MNGWYGRGEEKQNRHSRQEETVKVECMGVMDLRYDKPTAYKTGELGISWSQAGTEWNWACQQGCCITKCRRLIEMEGKG